MQSQKFFAVRVVIRYAGGSTAQRDYVRGEWRIGQARFASWALGDLLRMVIGDGGLVEGFDVVEIAPEQVYDNRRYHHTTH